MNKFVLHANTVIHLMRGKPYFMRKNSFFLYLVAIIVYKKEIKICNYII